MYSLVERLKSTTQLPEQLGKHKPTVDEHELLDLVDTINGLVLQLTDQGSQQLRRHHGSHKGDCE